MLGGLTRSLNKLLTLEILVNGSKLIENPCRRSQKKQFFFIHPEERNKTRLQRRKFFGLCTALLFMPTKLTYTENARIKRDGAFGRFQTNSVHVHKQKHQVVHILRYFELKMIECDRSLATLCVQSVGGMIIQLYETYADSFFISFDQCSPIVICRNGIPRSCNQRARAQAQDHCRS